MKDITDTAAVPKGSFYNYFDSKETFAVAVLEDYWSSIERAYGPILRDTRLTPMDRVTQYFRALTKEHSRRDFAVGCLIGNLALELADSSATIRATLAGLLDRWGRALSDCLRDAQAHGELAPDRDTVELAGLLIEVWEGAAMRGKVERDRGAYLRFEAVVVPRLAS